MFDPPLPTSATPQCPYRDRRSAKRLLRVYQLAHARVHAAAKPYREYLHSSNSETVIAWTSSDAELYVSHARRVRSSFAHEGMSSPPRTAPSPQVVFGPLVSKPVAIAACHKLLRRLKKEQSSLFLLTPVR